MKLNDMVLHIGRYYRARFRDGRASVDFLKSVRRSKGPALVDGYIKQAETDDCVLFSESPRSTSWVRISTRRIQQLEYFGREFVTDGVCAKVRLTL